MPENNFYWEDFSSELLSDLLIGQDIEEIARVLKLNPNTVACFTYKSKPQIPNCKQFGLILDQVFANNPGAVLRAFQKLGRRFGIVAVAGNEERAEFLSSLAREVQRVSRV